MSSLTPRQSSVPIPMTLCSSRLRISYLTVLLHWVDCLLSTRVVVSPVWAPRQEILDDRRRDHQEQLGRTLGCAHGLGQERASSRACLTLAT
eukprot:2356598-Amphidinium_carterae.1